MKFMLNREFGQSAIEFVLVVPILILLLFGIVDISRLIYTKMMLNQAGQEVSRSVSVGKSISDIDNTALNILIPVTGNSIAANTTSTDENGSACTKITVTPSMGETVTILITPTYTNSISVGSQTRVLLKYKFKYITPISTVLGNSIDLKSINYTRIENAPQ